MATYSKSNFGQINGAVGEAVGTKWRGVKVMRSIPDKRKKGPSVLQQMTLAKMALAARQLSPIKEVLRRGYRDQKLSGITGYNAAIRAFIQQSIAGEYPDFSVNYANMELSRGSLTPLSEVTLNHNDIGILLSWELIDNETNSFPEDEVFIILFNENTRVYSTYVTKRINEGILIKRSLKPGQTTHIWLFAANAGRVMSSNTIYAGSVGLPPNPEED